MDPVSARLLTAIGGRDGLRLGAEIFALMANLQGH